MPSTWLDAFLAPDPCMNAEAKTMSLPNDSKMGRSAVRKNAQVDLECTVKSPTAAWMRDPLELLGHDILVNILGHLAPDDLARCGSVTRRWRNVTVADELWMPHCMDLIRDCSHTRVSQLHFGDRYGGEDEEKQRQKQHDGRRWYAKHMSDTERSQITKEELCGLCWKFRFKRQAGEFWLSWDPYWTKSGPQMQRVFHEDGTVLGIPSHEPFWFQDSECRWRFTKSREGKRGGPFVKVNHWPSLVVSRQNGFGWRMENCWVVYESIDPEVGEAEAILQEWESSRVQKCKLASGLDSLWTLQ